MSFFLLRIRLNSEINFEVVSSKKFRLFFELNYLHQQFAVAADSSRLFLNYFENFSYFGNYGKNIKAENCKSFQVFFKKKIKILHLWSN